MYSKEELKKRLIVNADDFGLDPAINLGIIETFDKGIVTNASLLVCGRAFEEAIELARKHKNLGIGIHLAINEEGPVSDRDKIRSLLNKDGDSFLNYPVFLRRLLSGDIILNQVYFELETQIEKFMKTGLRPTHLDSHKHIHLIPKIFRITLELARKFNISCIRFSRSKPIDILSSRRYFKAVGVLGLSAMTNFQLRKIKTSMIKTSDYCYGLIESGSLNASQLNKILSSLHAGTSELICHPGFVTDGLLNKYKWGYHWLTELEVLTSASARSIVEGLNIQLIRYDEI